MFVSWIIYFSDDNISDCNKSSSLEIVILKVFSVSCKCASVSLTINSNYRFLSSLDCNNYLTFKSFSGSLLSSLRTRVVIE